MTTHMGLGLIPAWQFSMDPAVNYKINPNVVYPDGVYQTTPQPLYPYYQGPEGGLGSIVSAIKSSAYAKAYREYVDRAHVAGREPFDNPGMNGFGAAGPRVTLMGPSMNFQLLGAQLGRVRRQRTLMGLGLGLGAVALLGKLFGR